MNLEELEREQKLEIPKVGSLYQMTWCYYKHTFGLPKIGGTVFIHDRSIETYPSFRRVDVILHCIWGKSWRAPAMLLGMRLITPLPYSIALENPVTPATPVNEAVPGKLYRLTLLNYEEDKRLTNLDGKVILFVSYRKTPKYHPASGSRREYGIMKFLHGDHLESFKRDVRGISLEEVNDP